MVHAENTISSCFTLTILANILTGDSHLTLSRTLLHSHPDYPIYHPMTLTFNRTLPSWEPHTAAHQDITWLPSWGPHLWHWCSTGHFFIPIWRIPSITLTFNRTLILHYHPQSPIYDTSAQQDITSFPSWEPDQWYFIPSWEPHLWHCRSAGHYFITILRAPPMTLPLSRTLLHYHLECPVYDTVHCHYHGGYWP